MEHIAPSNRLGLEPCLELTQRVLESFLQALPVGGWKTSENFRNSIALESNFELQSSQCPFVDHLRTLFYRAPFANRNRDVVFRPGMEPRIPSWHDHIISTGSPHPCRDRIKHNIYQSWFNLLSFSPGQDRKRCLANVRVEEDEEAAYRADETRATRHERTHNSPHLQLRIYCQVGIALAHSTEINTVGLFNASRGQWGMLWLLFD